MKAATAKSEKSNAADVAYDYLLNKTVSFGFYPGERINEGEVATTLEMSRAPVREALNRLSAQNFVASIKGKGFCCRKLSVTELIELMEVRADLELSAIRHVCEKAATQVLEDFIKERTRALNINPADVDNKTILEIDESFHMGIVAIANNTERSKILENINNRIRFVRQIALEEEYRRETIFREHNAILEALACRDIYKAAAAMESHMRNNSEEFKETITKSLARIYADEVL